MNKRFTKVCHKKKCRGQFSTERGHWLQIASSSHEKDNTREVGIRPSTESFCRSRSGLLSPRIRCSFSDQFIWLVLFPERLKSLSSITVLTMPPHLYIIQHTSASLITLQLVVLELELRVELETGLGSTVFLLLALFFPRSIKLESPDRSNVNSYAASSWLRPCIHDISNISVWINLNILNLPRYLGDISAPDTTSYVCSHALCRLLRTQWGWLSAVR